jgi:GxxExxY protein
MADLEVIARDVVDLSVRIHRQLGPGLLESVYQTVLAAALTRAGHSVQRQVPVDFTFDGMQFTGAFRVDLLIDGRFVVEVKSVEKLTGVHAKQLLTYLRLMGQPLGLLLNFSGETMKEGIRRLVNNHGHER